MPPAALVHCLTYPRSGGAGLLRGPPPWGLFVPSNLKCRVREGGWGPQKHVLTGFIARGCAVPWAQSPPRPAPWAGDRGRGSFMPSGRGPVSPRAWAWCASVTPNDLSLLFPREWEPPSICALARRILPHRTIIVGIRRNCQASLGHHEEECLAQLSPCFPTVITSVINLCHLTVLHFEKRKWKKDPFQTNLHHSLKSQSRVDQMSNLALSHSLK